MPSERSPAPDNDEQSTTRDRIVAAAGRLFADHGVKATPVSRIEEEAGLTPGSGGVHRYFATKSDLVEAVLDTQLAHGRRGQETVQDWPLPAPEDARSFLELIGRFALAESEHARELALISLREGRSFGEAHPRARDENFELAFRSAADQIRRLQAELDDDRGIDADAFGFLLIGPLIYYRVITWLSDAPPLDVSEDDLITTWSAIFTPIAQELLGGRPSLEDD